jgi:hypothetical protein
MVVYVINKYGRELMSCSPRTARLLLKDSAAKVIRRDPFTIKLLVGVKGYTQSLTHCWNKYSEILRKYYWRKTFFGVQVILFVQSEMLLLKQLKDIYKNNDTEAVHPGS